MGVCLNIVYSRKLVREYLRLEVRHRLLLLVNYIGTLLIVLEILLAGVALARVLVDLSLITVALSLVSQTRAILVRGVVVGLPGGEIRPRELRVVRVDLNVVLVKLALLGIVFAAAQIIVAFRSLGHFVLRKILPPGGELGLALLQVAVLLSNPPLLLGLVLSGATQRVIAGTEIIFHLLRVQILETIYELVLLGRVVVYGALR